MLLNWLKPESAFFRPKPKIPTKPLMKSPIRFLRPSIGVLPLQAVALTRTRLLRMPSEAFAWLLPVRPGSVAGFRRQAFR